MRWILFSTIAVALLLFTAVITNGRQESPELVIDNSVAADFAQVADAEWEMFVASFPAMESCLGRVTLVADHTLDDRARYDPQTRTMTVRVPGPKVLLDRALVHELAHSLEFSCASQVKMRPAFLAALGRDGNEAWFEGPEWGLIPSEIFAEAVVEYVLDERGRAHTGIGLIDQHAVDVVIRWANGG
ncbi:MAG: hypothetical protein GXP34_10980 [Actinobacteria bacterium]|nr:hypothetical protein [Actinomycetota bacterium]